MDLVTISKVHRNNPPPAVTALPLKLFHQGLENAVGEEAGGGGGKDVQSFQEQVSLELFGQEKISI